VRTALFQSRPEGSLIHGKKLRPILGATFARCSAGKKRRACRSIGIHNKLPSIYAYTAELDEWWGQGRAAVDEGSGRGESLRRSMLVVLPLKNLSGRADQEYFSDGFTEELIGQLSRLAHESLSVIARGSAMVYKHSTKGVDQIARELGVEYVLDGSVRRDGSRVRISVALIRAKERTYLWTEDYDRELSDVLSLQTEVARSVSNL
jgi:TolB-like protein